MCVLTQAQFWGQSIAPFVESGVMVLEESRPVAELQQYCAQLDNGIICVTNQRKLSGVITANSVAEAWMRPRTVIGDLATRDVVAIKQEAQLWQLLKILNGENAFRKILDWLPVVNERTEVVGLVTRSSLRLKLSMYQIV